MCETEKCCGGKWQSEIEHKVTDTDMIHCLSVSLFVSLTFRQAGLKILFTLVEFHHPVLKLYFNFL